MRSFEYCSNRSIASRITLSLSMRFREAIMNAHPQRAAKSADSKNISDNEIKYQYKWLLLSIGAWPQTTIVKKILVSIQIVISASSVAVVMIPCLLYVLFDDDSIQIRLGALVSLLFRIMSTATYWVIITRQKDIYDCILHMSADWKRIQRTTDRKLMIKYDKIGNFLVKLSTSFVFFGSHVFIIARAAKTITFTIGNETFKTHPMACPIYKKIIDVRFSPANEIFLFLQFLSSLVSNCIIVAFFSIAAVCAMHACGQLQVLYTWLNEVVQNHEENNLAQEKIGDIVEHHLRIFSFTTNLESIMSRTCLITIMACTLQLCFLGYYAIMNWAAFDAAKMASYICVYTSISYCIFVYCYIGEVVTEQCKQVAEVAYMTEWYKLPYTIARNYVLIILRSNQAVKMTAGKMLQLSIATFADSKLQWYI
ncbi:odorant receptor Or2-like isoform X2 [Linepithema humile]|uniref:odorant receptor Or2-like isoform X2 n=1 Tax=Linepithema humile TaxID=83485 RepID=UPI00351ED8C6